MTLRTAAASIRPVTNQAPASVGQRSLGEVPPTGVRSPALTIRSFGPRTWPLAAAFLAVLLAAPMMQAPLSVFDGGIAASAGTFILHGRLPYRDFWLLYGPLTAYLAAALTLVFGANVTVLRLAGIGLMASTALLGYRIVQDRAPGIAGTLLAATAAAVGARWTGVDLWPWALGMTLVLAAILVARRGTRRSLEIAGLILGLAVLARQDLGVYGLLAVVISARTWRPLAGAAVVVVPAAVLFILLTPIGVLWQQLVWYPLVGPREFRGLPGPALLSPLDPGKTLAWLLYWPPLVVIGLALVRLWQDRSIPVTYGALLILAILCRFQTLGRADEGHSVEAITPVILLLAFALSRPHRGFERVGLSVGAGLLVALSALPFTTLGAPADPYDAALMTAVGIVRSQTAPGEPIFVGEVHNLHTLLNPLLAYYLADRPAGVSDTMYNPGVTNTAATQTQMVAELRANRVRFLILDVRFADCFEPANASREAGPPILDQEIDRAYAVVANLGTVVVMGRRGDVAPANAPPLSVEPGLPISGTMTCPAAPTP